MSRYEDDLSRGRSDYSRDRDHAYADDRHAVVYEPSIRRPASPGHSTHNGLTSQARLTYEPQTPLYSPRSSPNLEVPESHSRPRSLPPLIEYRRSSRDTIRERSHSKRGGSELDDVDGDWRARTPVGKSKNFVDNAFTDSRTGLGVGVLGALLGGLAVREATNMYNSNNHNNDNNNGQGHRRHNSHGDAEHKRNQILGAVVGAAVGALGANAVEKRIEVNREKDRAQQERWERRWRPRRVSGGGDLIERREVVARPRSRGGHYHHRGAESSGSSGDSSSRRRRGHEREVDPGARSWKNVEDWLYDDENREHDRDMEEGRKPRSSGKRSVDSYHY